MPWTVEDVDRFKQGLTDAQKRQWVEVANNVLERCLADGGSQSECEASAIRQANGTVANRANILKSAGYRMNQADYIPQERVWEGRKYIVVPTVLLVEGVHNDVYYPAEELQKFPEAWNGIPVPVYHPVQEGTPISCNDPEIVSTQVVGRLWNVSFDSGKLKGEIWIDVEKANAIEPSLVSAIPNGCFNRVVL